MHESQRDRLIERERFREGIRFSGREEVSETRRDRDRG